MAPLRYAAKCDPFLSLDCATTPSTLAQSKERKGSNFALWQPSLPCLLVFLLSFSSNATFGSSSPRRTFWFLVWLSLGCCASSYLVVPARPTKKERKEGKGPFSLTLSHFCGSSGILFLTLFLSATDSAAICQQKLKESYGLTD